MRRLSSGLFFLNLFVVAALHPSQGLARDFGGYNSPPALHTRGVVRPFTSRIHPDLVRHDGYRLHRLDESRYGLGYNGRRGRNFYGYGYGWGGYGFPGYGYGTAIVSSRETVEQRPSGFAYPPSIADLPAVSGIRSAPGAEPVVYVIRNERSSFKRRGQSTGPRVLRVGPEKDGARKGASLKSLEADSSGPRIIQVKVRR